MALRFDAGKVITAMVTPFNNKLEVDYEKLETLTKNLIKNGSDTILIVGTTGEAPTLTHEEEIEILSSVKRACANQAKVIMGAGSNSTAEAIKYSKFAEKEGADAILSIVPYYNKPSQAGMIAHFSKIAESTSLPIIMYNIPSRTGVNMLPETAKYLAEKYENIVALKQSAPDLDAISELVSICPKDFAIYSGDDSLTLPMLSLGAKGVISVASHIYGTKINEMITEFEEGNIDDALAIHLKLFPVFKKLFMAPNPTPVKAALARMGLIEDFVRSPLVTLTDNQKSELYAVLDLVKFD